MADGSVKRVWTVPRLATLPIGTTAGGEPNTQGCNPSTEQPDKCS